MDREERFDCFYRSSRAALLHQCFALTGDLRAAQAAVRDAFVAAWHHWRKADAHGSPERWVRPRAWALAHRRHTARIWRRTKDIPEAQVATLDALARLPYQQRRMLLLGHLAEVPLPEAAGELGLTQAAAARLLQEATSLFALQRDVAPAAVGPVLEALAEVTAGASLPRPSAVRRAGRRRRRSHTVLATLAAAAVALLSGAIAYQPAPAPATAPLPVTPSPSAPAGSSASAPSAPVTPADLLDADRLAGLGGHQHWTVVPMAAAADVLDAHCRPEGFADPHRLSGQVRAFHADGRPPRSLVQRVETSASPARAGQAFATTVGWYTGCEMARLQLLAGYRVDGVGDAATLLRFRVWQRPVLTYWVGVARAGAVTTSVVSSTVAGPAPPVRQAARSLADAVAALCAGGQGGAGGCVAHPSVTAVPAPSPPAERGLLTAVDLPPVGTVRQPWVGTTPAAPQHNPAATVCDQAHFARSGAVRVRARTFVIPEASLPTRFGLSETYGLFATPAKARAFLATMLRRVHDCEVRHIATTVRPGPGRPREPGVQPHTWRLDTAVSARRTVRFRLGFVRVGAAVAEVTFCPAEGEDIPADEFRAVVLRAGERLRVLEPTMVAP